MKKKILTVLLSFLCLYSYSQKDKVYEGTALGDVDWKLVYHLKMDLWPEQGYLPEFIMDYKNLESIDLGTSLLFSIPDWLIDLKNLKTISFDDKYLDCDGQNRMKTMKISNPQGGKNTVCYLKSFGAENIVYLNSGKSSEIRNAEYGNLMFGDEASLYVTPCNRSIIFTSDSIYFTSNDHSGESRNDFEKIPLPSKVKEIEMEHCEGGTHLLTLENGDLYRLSNWDGVLVKAAKNNEYDIQTDCEKVIDAIEGEGTWNLKQTLMKYYSLCDCDETMLVKAKQQSDKVISNSENYYWNTELQDISERKNQRDDWEDYMDK